MLLNHVKMTEIESLLHKASLLLRTCALSGSIFESVRKIITLKNGTLPSAWRRRSSNHSKQSILGAIQMKYILLSSFLIIAERTKEAKGVMPKKEINFRVSSFCAGEDYTVTRRYFFRRFFPFRFKNSKIVLEKMHLFGKKVREVHQ